MSSSVLSRRCRSTFTKNSLWRILLDATMGKMARGFQRRRAAAALHTMSDYQLRDIGISRAQIDGVVDRGRF